MKSLLTLSIALFLIAAQGQDEATQQRDARAGSLLNRPLYLGEEPPPMRAARNIVLLHERISQRVVKHDSKRTLNGTLEIAQAITEDVCSIVRTERPLAASQTRSVLSPPADTIQRPSALTAQAIMLPL